MSSRSTAAVCGVLLLIGVAALAAPVAARPPPRPVSGFAHFADGEYSPHGYPTSGVANVTLAVDVAANGTSTWRERATLTNDSAVAALRANDSLRRAVVAERFGYRFDRHTTHLRSRLDGDALAVTYRIDGVVHRGPAGGVLFAPFAGYENVYYPGIADVTIHGPDGYRVVAHPAAMVSRGDTLRWNATTGPGKAGVEPGLMTFAPVGAAFPGVRGHLAVVGTYGLYTLRVGARYALLLGVPLALVTTGFLALARRERRTLLSAGGVTVLLVGVATIATRYPVSAPALYVLAVPVAVLCLLFGAALHVVAWRRRVARRLVGGSG